MCVCVCIPIENQKLLLSVCVVCVCFVVSIWILSNTLPVFRSNSIMGNTFTSYDTNGRLVKSPCCSCNGWKTCWPSCHRYEDVYEFESTAKNQKLTENSRDVTGMTISMLSTLIQYFILHFISNNGKMNNKVLSGISAVFYN